MSGKKPLFVSAPRLVIGITNSEGKFVKVAFAIGLSVNVSVAVQPVYVLGDFGPVSYEPTSMPPCTGSMQIVRLQPKSLKDIRVANSKTLYKDSKVIRTPDSTIRASVEDGDNNILIQNNLWTHLNPAEVLTSQSFDIDVYLNVNGYGHAINTAAIQSFNSAVAQAPGTGGTDLVRFMRIKDCRLTSRNVNLAQGQLINEPVNFMGLLAQQYLDGNAIEQLDSLISENAV